MATPALPQPAARRRGTWAAPFLLALAFTLALGVWLQWSLQADVEDEHRTLLADALTMESRVSDALAAEQQAVATLAAALTSANDAEALLRQPAVVDGLRRLWVSVTVLDAGNRVRAHVPQQAPRPAPPVAPAGFDEGGISAHIARPTADGGRVVVRIAPAALLRQAVPWWLARKYEVRIVDGLGQRLAGASETLPPEGRQTHQVSLEPGLTDAFLEVTTREARVPWWRTPMPLVMALFLALSGGATALLRRRLHEVEAAEERWRTEAAWRQAVENSLSVGLRARDLEGRIVHVNRAFCDLVGLPPEQLLGRAPPMPWWPPDGVDDGMQRHLRNMAGGAPREGYEARWQRADGRPLDVIVLEAPLVDAQGRSIGWMGSIVDVTARKAAEERERRRGEALATQARLTTLGEVASALAHQLNQPLAAIAGYNAGVLRSLERAGGADPVLLDALRKLGEQAAEAGRIVQRIRGFLTRRAPQRERCASEGILSRAVALVSRDLRARGVEVELVPGPPLPAVDADPVLVEQVLINLLRNAADAMAGQAAPRLRVEATRAGPRFLRVDVDDNGPGLGGLGIDALSAPFHTTKADGMGMGLAICRSVIEAHHGALEAGASPLGGARFTFTLPLAEATETRDAAEPARP